MMPRPRISIQTRLMVTIVGTFVASMLLVLASIWIYTQIGMSGVDIIVGTTEIVPADQGNTVSGAVRTEAIAASDSPQPRLLLFGLAILAIILLVAVFSAWIINRQTFGRIQRITAFAHGLDERQWDVRFDPTSQNDEIDQMITAINSALDRLQAGFDRQRMFVRAASHELRTPLTVARAALEIPLVEGRVPPDLRADIEQALVSQTRLESILDSLLALSRGESQPPDRTRISLDDTIRALVADIRTPPAITWDLELDAITTDVDYGAFRTVVGNLLENAVVHGHQGGWCAVRLAATADFVTIGIENSGQVVDAELLARIRQPFAKRDGSPGSGLGLALVEQYTSTIGGELRITARADGGLTIVVLWPVTPDSAIVDRANRASHHRAG